MRLHAGVALAMHVSMLMVRWVGIIALAVGLAASAPGCGSSTTAATTVVSITLTGIAPSVGGHSQLTAIANYLDGTTKDVTAVATWQTSNNTIATVSATGLVQGVAVGLVTITVTYQGVSGAITFNI